MPCVIRWKDKQELRVKEGITFLEAQKPEAVL
jgi:hypothetical protein